MQSFKSKLFQNENNMRDVKDILDEAQESMDMAIMYLDEALAHIRAGKADIRLLEVSVWILMEVWFLSTMWQP